jgi:hypothetical protein
MSDSPPPAASPPPPNPEDVMAALFANLVMQQTQMALMLLGRVAHPESGQTMQDVDGARMLIDQLEMLAVKTHGNLTEAESKLLRQNLMALHMAFVEAVEHEGSAPASAPSPTPAPASTPTSPAPAAEAPTATPDTESRKKFSKKY